MSPALLLVCLVVPSVPVPTQKQWNVGDKVWVVEDGRSFPGEVALLPNTTESGWGNPRDRYAIDVWFEGWPRDARGSIATVVWRLRNQMWRRSGLEV